MTPENFVFWLQGYAELVNEEPDEVQWKIIRNHIDLVLTKVTAPVPYQLRPSFILKDNELPTITC